MDVEHPPLAKAIFAIPFRNVFPPATDHWVTRGNEILNRYSPYTKSMARARIGNLLFVALGLLAVFFWTRDLFGDVTALVAAGIFASVPVVLAHGGLATTDMAGTAALAVSLLVLYRWLDDPTWRRTLFLALAVALGLTTKFSFALFFALSAIIAMIAKRRIPVVKGFVAHAGAFLIVWAVFFFSVGTMAEVEPDTKKFAEELWKSSYIAEKVVLPAPAFFAGLLKVRHHDVFGHFSYLLGEYSDKGWWYYFPIAILVKTPIPLLLLFFTGIVLTIKDRRHPEAGIMALAILASSMTSHINLGVRHVMPMYVPMCAVAAYAVVRLWRPLPARAVAAGMALWLFANSALAHPDYLPWMNAIAGPRPEQVLVDSNLDWGQDLIRLRRELRKRGIKRYGSLIFSCADGVALGIIDWYDIKPYERSSGWIVVSESAIQLAQAQDRNAYRWLTEGQPFERIGKTLRLYYLGVC